MSPSQVPGVIHPDTIIPGTRTITIKSSPEQDRAMQAYIDAATEKPGNYNLWGRNCTVFAANVLRAGDLKAPNSIDPGEFLKQLAEMHALKPEMHGPKLEIR